MCYNLRLLCKSSQAVLGGRVVGIYLSIFLAISAAVSIQIGVMSPDCMENVPQSKDAGDVSHNGSIWVVGRADDSGVEDRQNSSPDSVSVHKEVQPIGC